jgi:prepilin-type N-terminal cleavage/methylation domain-containing protein
MASLRHDDSGFSLIEVLVSAMLVALIAVGVLSMFDSASATSGRERARTQAASLANREIARYKAMSPVNLMALAGTTQTRSITLAKQAYNLSTTIDWAPDQTGDDVVCTGSGPPQYLKLVTTVSTPAGGPLSGVSSPTVTNFVSIPPGSPNGTLRVSVKDQGTTPVSGATVTLTGPTTKVTTTNANGCAVVSNLPKGTYTATLSKSVGGVNWVDQQGNASPSTSGAVYSGQVTDVSFNAFAKSGTINVTWFSTAGYTPVLADRLGVQGGAITGTSYFGTARVTGTVANFQPSISASGLYPSASAFKISGGDCAPEQAFFALSPAGLTAGQTVAQTYPLSPVDITTQKSGVTTPGMTVRFIKSEAGCTVYKTSTYTSDATGHLKVALLPGHWDTCVQSGTFSLTKSNVPNASKPAIITAPPAVTTTTVNATGVGAAC